MQDRAARQHHGEDQAHDHEREILGRAEDQRELGERGAERRDDEGRHGAGEERADGRDAERHAGAALAGHLVAVERGDHGGRLAGNVDQDRRGRAAVLGAVVDAGQHDQRAGRIEPEGDRQQHGDGGDRPDAGQHADQRADEAAEEGEAEVLQAERDAEAEAQVGEEITHQILPLWSATSTEAGRRLRVARNTRTAARGHDAGGGPQHRLLRPVGGKEAGERLREDRDRQVEQVAEQHHAEGREAERQDDEVAQARLGGGVAADDDGERPGEEQAEARRGQPAAEGEGADGQGEGHDSSDDEDRTTQAPALEPIAVLEEGGGEQGQARQADPDGEPARQHGRAHGIERALVEIPRQPQGQRSKRDEKKSAGKALRRTYDPATPTRCLKPSGFHRLCIDLGHHARSS